MILVVDGGSTKTDWGFKGKGRQKLFKTQGISPVHQSHEQICSIIENELLAENDGISTDLVDRIFFYGSGCATEQLCKNVQQILSMYFKNAEIEVESDMLGAARALCGHNEGIACVLGTGSNSCYFDGEKIADQVPSLGYILGDEGSASALGRRLISDCLKRQVPDAVANEFLDRYGLTTDVIIENTYRKPMANRWMASLTGFLLDKRSIPEVHNLIISCFTEFYHRNVMNYHRPWLPVSFIGSLAWSFAPELTAAAESLALSTGTILRSPLPALLKYHQ